MPSNDFQAGSVDGGPRLASSAMPRGIAISGRYAARLLRPIATRSRSISSATSGGRVHRTAAQPLGASYSSRASCSLSWVGQLPRSDHPPARTTRRLAGGRAWPAFLRCCVRGIWRGRGDARKCVMAMHMNLRSGLAPGSPSPTASWRSHRGTLRSSSRASLIWLEMTACSRYTPRCSRGAGTESVEGFTDPGAGAKGGSVVLNGAILLLAARRSRSGSHA